MFRRCVVTLTVGMLCLVLWNAHRDWCMTAIVAFIVGSIVLSLIRSQQ